MIQFVTIAEPNQLITCDMPTVDDYGNEEDYSEELAESACEVLNESPVFNRMVSLNGKAKRRLINVLIDNNGDLREAVSVATFKNLNVGDTPPESSIIHFSNLGTNDNAGKVDIHTAVDMMYSELGYKSAQDMLDDCKRMYKLWKETK